MTELAERLDWPKSTVHSHLQTLENCEYVAREGDTYVLGFRFLDIGEHVKHRDEVYSMAASRIEALAEETDERVQFVVDEHGDGVYVRIAEGKRAISTGSRLGRRRNMLHATAAGKAILAYEPREKVQRVVENKWLPELTSNTITDEEELYAELRAISDLGYAFNREEHIEGLRAIAAPVVSPDDEIVGSISVAGAVYRMRGEYFTETLEPRDLSHLYSLRVDNG